MIKRIYDMISMKSIKFSISGLLLMAVATIPVYSQSLKISVVTHPVTVAGQNNGSVDITITEGNPDFTYSLYTALPWEGGKELAKSKQISKYDYSFDQLATGNYVVMVKDKNGNGAFEKITIELQPALGWNIPVIDKQNNIFLASDKQHHFSGPGPDAATGYYRVQPVNIAGQPEKCIRI
jgi:hypothetical protein